MLTTCVCVAPCGPSVCGTEGWAVASPRRDPASHSGLVRGIAEELREGSQHEVEADRASRRSVRAVGLLLIAQTVALALVGFSRTAQLGWRRLLPGDPGVSFEDAIFTAFFGPSAILALLGGLGFLLLARRGWTLAALSQGLSLGGCLWFYANGQPSFVYPLMLSCVIAVLYLNSHDVRVRFNTRPGDSREP